MIHSTISGTIEACKASDGEKKPNVVKIDDNWVNVWRADVDEFQKLVVDGKVKDLPVRVRAYVPKDEADKPRLDDDGNIIARLGYSFAGTRSTLSKLVAGAAAPNVAATLVS